MKIAFWSNVRHQSGVTSSVAVISILWAELYAEEIAVTSNHICNGSLVKRLHGGSEQEEKAARRAYCYTLGEPEYFRMLYGGKTKTALWLNDSLYYFPMEGEGGELFYDTGLKGIEKQMGDREYLIIDTACGCGSSSQRILQEAEITVVLLPPEREGVDAFFKSETPLRENSFFILGNYRSVPPYCPSNLAQKYKVPRERIGQIPYNYGFEQAMREGSTIAFIAGNLNCSKRSKEYHFIRCAKKTVESLRKYAISRRDELCADYVKV
ncbi:MAG: hypothetical protein PUC30_09865 [Lachnospiraceae bacterium]|nr:hypothetical protein [Lachnospiraceae bacterium]